MRHLSPPPGQCSAVRLRSTARPRCQDGDRIDIGRDRRVRRKDGPQVGRGLHQLRPSAHYSLRPVSGHVQQRLARKPVAVASHAAAGTRRSVVAQPTSAGRPAGRRLAPGPSVSLLSGTKCRAWSPAKSTPKAKSFALIQPLSDQTHNAGKGSAVSTSISCLTNPTFSEISSHKTTTGHTARTHLWKHTASESLKPACCPTIGQSSQKGRQSARNGAICGNLSSCDP
jgi:hypothetical protein